MKKCVVIKVFGHIVQPYWSSWKNLSWVLVVFQVTEIRLKYFDTIPVAAAMCVLKTGFLFVASEFGNQWVSKLLLQVLSFPVGSWQPEFVVSSVTFTKLLIWVMMTRSQSSPLPCRWRRATHSSFSLGPWRTWFWWTNKRTCHQSCPARCVSLGLRVWTESEFRSDFYLFKLCQIADLANEDTPQLYVACGRGSRSTLRVLRHGLEVHAQFHHTSHTDTHTHCWLRNWWGFHVSSLTKAWRVCQTFWCQPEGQV